MTVTVSSKGQIVIPSELRKRYNLKAKSKIEFLDNGSELIIIPLPKDPFKASYGILRGKGITTKDLMEFRRKERKRENARLRKL